MSVTVHPAPGQSVSDLTRELLAVAGDPREVRSVTGGRSGVRVPDGVAHAYLSGRLGVAASGSSLLGVEQGIADPAPVAVEPAAGPAPVVVSAPVVVPEPATDPFAFTPRLPPTLTLPQAPTVPDPLSAPVAKRVPGRPRKTALPAAVASEVF